MTQLSPCGQAVYLSELPTGSPISPSEAAHLRAQAVAEMGFDGLRRAQTIAALRNAALIPDGHVERCHWAHAVARFVDVDGPLGAL